MAGRRMIIWEPKSQVFCGWWCSSKKTYVKWRQQSETVRLLAKSSSYITENFNVKIWGLLPQIFFVLFLSVFNRGLKCAIMVLFYGKIHRTNLKKRYSYVSRWQFNVAYWLYQINMMQGLLFWSRYLINMLYLKCIFVNSLLKTAMLYLLA